MQKKRYTPLQLKPKPPASPCLKEQAQAKITEEAHVQSIDEVEASFSKHLKEAGLSLDDINDLEDSREKTSGAGLIAEVQADADESMDHETLSQMLEKAEEIEKAYSDQNPATLTPREEDPPIEITKPIKPKKNKSRRTMDRREAKTVFSDDDSVVDSRPSFVRRKISFDDSMGYSFFWVCFV